MVNGKSVGWDHFEQKQELLHKTQHIRRLTLQVGGCPCTHGVHCYIKKDAIAALMRPRIKSAWIGLLSKIARDRIDPSKAKNKQITMHWNQTYQCPFLSLNARSSWNFKVHCLHWCLLNRFCCWSSSGLEALMPEVCSIVLNRLVPLRKRLPDPSRKRFRCWLEAIPRIPELVVSGVTGERSKLDPNPASAPVKKLAPCIEAAIAALLCIALPRFPLPGRLLW